MGASCQGPCEARSKLETKAMGGMIAAPDRDPFALMMQTAIIALQQIDCVAGIKKNAAMQ
ncbi:MAG: hypothetical protein ACTS5V_05940 [Giesbergeria sp.]